MTFFSMCVSHNQVSKYTNVLPQTELLDTFTVKETDEYAEIFTEEDLHVRADSVGFRNATFSWSNESDGSLTPSRRNFVLRIEEELLFRKGHINLVIGPTGSGKTSLLMALLGQGLEFTACMRNI